MGSSRPFRSVAVVVEDDPIQREMLASLLEEGHFEVIQCEDAQTADLALAKRHPALLVTDVNLVGAMSGLELARKARQLHPEIRVIVISGRPTPAVPDGVTFFAKPFYPTDLLREVERSEHAEKRSRLHCTLM
ncbi:response regulator [Bradyrhizobium lablabi]|uniref:response regulator n=1 Tax=Bradyrhizobium lablabi TaxID=722472 RepID=UPI001BADD28D|nr:response regulator [Bradyrhizobium lablabi]MBR1120431.1 response regulator [Bradyrhizobium lablabi]